MRSSSTGPLGELLASLFTHDELSRFLMLRYDSVYNEMGRGLSLAALADHAAQALHKRGQIDEELQDALVAARPGRRSDVIQALCPERSVERRRWISGRVALTTVLGGAALLGGTSLLVERIPPTVSDGGGAGGPYFASALREGVVGAGEVVTSVAELLAMMVRPCPEGMVAVFPGGERSVAAFCLDIFEVTRGDLGLSCPMEPAPEGLSGVLYEKMADRCELDGASAEWARHPVTWIDGREAEAYCTGRGRRLPRLQEWSAAAAMDLEGREEKTWGRCMNVCDRSCWESGGYEPGEDWFHHTDRYPKTAPVGSYGEVCPSPMGASDVHGNVREFVRDGEDYSLCGAGWRSYLTGDLALDRWCETGGKLEPRQDSGFRCALDFPAVILGSS